MVVHTCNFSTWEVEEELEVSLGYIKRPCLKTDRQTDRQTDTHTHTHTHTHTNGNFRRVGFFLCSVINRII
jgi:hypothetical protein